MGEPEWVRHAIWWHVYPLGFTGADVTGADRVPRRTLAHLVDWLGYATDLGASGLALGPVFASSTHGYDTVDHFRIDERLGDDADFDRLVAAAHERGLRVLLDGVFNHVGRDYPAFRRALAHGPGAPDAALFGLGWPPGARPGDEPSYIEFEGHHDLVTLDHANPAVVELVVDVMTYWLARGVDGWRLDAAYAVPREFWAEVVPRVRGAHPDAYLVGEVIHGDYAEIVADTGLDAVTQYELWKATWSSLNDRNFFELAWALARHDTYLDTFVPLTFVGNHDVTRLASRLDDDRHVAHALLVLLTVGGTPSLYYGDEQAFRGAKEERVGGDDAVRPPFPASPGELAAEGWPVYRLHQLLVGLRRRHPWLHTARTDVVELTNELLVYETRNGGDALLVALNIGVTPARHPVGARAGVLAADTGTVLEGADLVVAPHGWAVVAPA